MFETHSLPIGLDLTVSLLADKKDPQGGACMPGFEILLQKQLKGKQMQKEMSEFVHERIKIEEEYAKNLSKLSLSPLAAQEEGTMGEAWIQLKKSLHDEAEVHLKFSNKLHSEVEKPMLTFRSDHFKKDLKKYDHHIADLRKQLASRYAGVEKARKALADRQKDLEVKTQQLEVKLSNKTEEDIKKARRKSTQAGDDLMRSLDLYNQTQSKWFEEMVTTSMELEKLEVDRIEWIQQHLRQYTTLRHETDMFNQSMVNTRAVPHYSYTKLQPHYSCTMKQLYQATTTLKLCLATAVPHCSGTIPQLCLATTTL
ncbi:unnamed protein product [Arctogadus glacialis]